MMVANAALNAGNVAEYTLKSEEGGGEEEAGKVLCAYSNMA